MGLEDEHLKRQVSVCVATKTKKYKNLKSSRKGWKPTRKSLFYPLCSISSLLFYEYILCSWPHIWPCKLFLPIPDQNDTNKGNQTNPCSTNVLKPMEGAYTHIVSTHILASKPMEHHRQQHHRIFFVIFNSRKVKPQDSVVV